MLTNYVTSLIRTWVPIGVGLLVTFLATHFNVVLSGKTGDALVAVVTAAAGAVYYSVVRLLEERYPQLGWLLGKPAKPNYAQLQADGSYLVTDLEADLFNFTGPDPLEVEGSDPNVPGASTAAIKAVTALPPEPSPTVGPPTVG